MIEYECLVVQKAYKEAISEYNHPYSKRVEERITQIRGMYVRIMHAMAREIVSGDDKNKY